MADVKTYCYFADVESTKFENDLSQFYFITDNDKRRYRLDYKLACYVGYDFDKKQEFETFYTLDQQEFFEKLIKGATRKKKRIIYFHNLTFDSKFIFRYIYDYYDRIEPIKTASKIISISCYTKRERMKNGKKTFQFDKVCEIRDTLCLLLSSIKEIGQYVGLEKTEFDFDYSNPENIQKGINYCYNDCRIIYKGLEFLIDTIKNVVGIDYTIKDLPITVGSLSKKIIKYFYPDVFYQLDLEAETELRPFYFGGRTEAFNFNLLKDGKYFDVNSLYPAMLSLSWFSNGQYKIVHTDKLSLDNPKILAYICEIDEQQQIPLYPERLERICFTNGVKTVLMTRKELLWLTDNGYLENKIKILQVKKCVIAQEIIQFDKLFKMLYDTRIKYKEIDAFHPYVYFIKILMNSGYGKFGERPERTKQQFISNLENCNVDEMEIIDFDGTLLAQKKFIDYNIEINLLNAILTTSYGRFELWKMIQYCEKHGITVYYCDTDSIVIEGKDLSKLEKFFGKNQLGKWDIEVDYQYFQAIDSKEYIGVYFDKKENKDKIKVKFKGISNKYVDDYNKLMNHINEGTHVNQVASIYLTLRRHADVQDVFVIEKHKRTFFQKRKVNPDLTTKPVNPSIDDFDDIQKENEILILNQLQLHEQLLSQY